MIVFTTFRIKNTKGVERHEEQFYTLKSMMALAASPLGYLYECKQGLPLPVLAKVEKIYQSASLYDTECHLLARCIHVNVG